MATSPTDVPTASAPDSPTPPGIDQSLVDLWREQYEEAMTRVNNTQTQLESLIATKTAESAASSPINVEQRLASLEAKYQELDILVSRILRRELPHVAEAIDGLQNERQEDVQALRQYVDDQVTPAPVAQETAEAEDLRRDTKKSRKKRKKRKPDSSSESSTSTSSSSNTDSSDSEVESNDPLLTRGPKYPGLKSIRTGSSLHKSVLDYRYYRLTNRKIRRSAKETHKVKDHLKRLELTMNKRTFDGSDPVTVLTFLARMTRECNILEMTEGQAYIALPYFLSGMALQQFEAARNIVSSRQGGIGCWSESVQYLIQTYATETAVSQSIMDLRRVRQKVDEDENTYGSRLSIAAARCGNVHQQQELAMFFIDGLDTTIRTIVGRKYAETRHMSFIALVKFAQEEGTAVRAREKPFRRTPGSVDKTALLDQPSGEGPNMESGDVNLLGWTHNPQPRNLRVSDDRQTTPLPTGTTRSTPPPYRPPPQREPPANNTTNQRLICHDCYERGHVSRQCTTPIGQFNRVIQNYESLAEEEQRRVPRAGYTRARAAQAATLADTTATVATGEEPPPPTDVEHPENNGGEDTEQQAHLN